MGSHQQTQKTNDGSKQVRVDNWGIFFLQRLQMFFNRTDYCDLTLQFEGNVQLKVHKLVMNACTDYFQILEQTCEMIDDIIIMPAELQADVVLPIVNFMYTGMLEFHTSIFDKLYQTANVMNITVLTKLLDAQKIPSSAHSKALAKKGIISPIWNVQANKKASSKSESDLPAPLPGRKLPVWKRKNAPNPVSRLIPHFYSEPNRVTSIDPHPLDNTPKPTRFEWPDEELPQLGLFDSSFDDISYTTKPLLTQEEEPRPSTSFDSIRDTPDTNPRKITYSQSSVDMEDVKEYIKEQRIRANLAEDDDDDTDGDFSGDSNRVIHFESQKRKQNFECSPIKKVRFNINEKENQHKQAKISITQTTKRINTEVDHTKIISEVLKKYPSLVKKNKNIRLKILAKTSNIPPLESVTKNVIKKGPMRSLSQIKQASSTSKSVKVDEKNDDGPWKCQRCSTPQEPMEFVLYYLYRKHMTDVHNEKFDSKMCKFCGHKSTKHNLLMYHQYTKHGVKPPPAYNFPKCNQCPYIALTEALLARHKMNHTKHELQCIECKVTFTNQLALTSHVQITGHNGKSLKPNYDCQYCTKKFSATPILFSHIKQQHRDEARRDGIVSIDEIEDIEESDDEEEEFAQTRSVEDQDSKVKIISDVKLPSMEVPQSGTTEQQDVILEPSSEAEALNNVANGIATSLGLVDVVVLDENQQYILHTENQSSISNAQSEFIIPSLQETQTFTTAQQVISSEQNVITQSVLQSSDIGSTDELVMVLTDHDYGDGNNEMINNENSNIVVLYSHPIAGQENQFITSQGSLVLTSQSGLIELRDGNTVVTTATPHFITTNSLSHNNSHIESIEMIQREINQHPCTENPVPIQPESQNKLIQQDESISHTDTSLANTPQEVGVLTEPNIHEHVLPQEHIPLNVLQIDESQGVVDPMLPQTSSSKEAVPIVAENQVQEEETTNQEVTSIVTREAESNVMEVTENAKFTSTEAEITALPSEITNPLQNIPVQQNSLENSAVSNEQLNVSNATLTETIKFPKISKDDSTCPKINESKQEENDQLVINASAQDAARTEELQTNINTGREKSSSENLQVENTPIGNIPVLPTSEPDHVDEEQLQSSEKSLQLNEAIPSISDSKSLSTVDTNQVNDDSCETQSESNISQLAQEVSYPKQDNVLPQESICSLNERDSESSAEECVNVDMQRVKEKDENSEDTQISHDNSQDTGETNDSEVSQSLVIKSSVSQSDSNQSAKIILEDWDDTDSQQSDPKNVTNVHKLIDDWDDDEEEKKSN